MVTRASRRFFAYINMFLAFMFVLVTGNNFLMMFVGWEGVGVCSFLLIGFWFDKPNGEGWRNANAAKKAMIANRIGDFGMLMGIFLMFWTSAPSITIVPAKSPTCISSKRRCTNTSWSTLQRQKRATKGMPKKRPPKARMEAFC